MMLPFTVYTGSVAAYRNLCGGLPRISVIFSGSSISPYLEQEKEYSMLHVEFHVVAGAPQADLVDKLKRTPSFKWTSSLKGQA